MKKLIFSLLVASLFSGIFLIGNVYAAEETSGVKLGTLIPQATVWSNCKETLDYLEKQTDPSYYFKHPEQNTQDPTGNTYRNDILSCAIQTGRIHLWMIPYYVVYLIEFLIGISGLIAVLFLVVAGFQYVSSGLAEAKDKAKGTIKTSLIGLGVVLAAWAVVNLVQYLVTL